MTEAESVQVDTEVLERRQSRPVPDARKREPYKRIRTTTFEKGDRRTNEVLKLELQMRRWRDGRADARDRVRTVPVVKGGDRADRFLDADDRVMTGPFVSKERTRFKRRSRPVPDA